MVFNVNILFLNMTLLTIYSDTEQKQKQQQTVSKSTLFQVVLIKQVGA